MIVSETYNLLTNPGHTPKYHMLLGIKLLLVLQCCGCPPHHPAQESAPSPHDDWNADFRSDHPRISAYLRRIF